MTTIYVPAEYKELVDRLARSETEKGGKRIFPTYMHVLVFAAMVGHAKGELRRIENRGPEVYDHIFVDNGFDGLAYLLALHHERDGDILRDANESQCWNIVQEYAAAGLDEIDDWLKNSPSDADGVRTILSRMKEKATDLVASDDSQLTPDIDFDS